VPGDQAEGLAGTRFGASGYDRHDRDRKGQELEAGTPVSADVCLGDGKLQ
jgi:hypothetical protein